MNINKKAGMTFIEIIITVAIISVISAIVFINLSSFRNQQVLNSTANDIISLLNKARQDTLSSINSTNYSVHFDSDKMILFTGSNYSSTDSTNEQIPFDGAVSIPVSGGLNLGGGNNVTFERLTGETTGGTITLQLNSNTSRTKLIIINKTGIIN